MQALRQRKRKAVSLNIPSHPFSLICSEGAIIPSLSEIILDAFGRFEKDFSVLSTDQTPIQLPPQLSSKLIQKIANNPNATDVDLNLVLYRLLASGAFVNTLDIHGTHLLTKVTCLNIFQLCSILQISSLDISYARGCGSDELAILCKSFPKLKHLNASSCIAFDDFCFASILQNSPPLETVNISGCNRITDYGLQCIGNIPTLRIFKGNNNNSFTIQGLQYIRNLTEIEILNCRSLTDDCLQLLASNNPNLTSVSLSSQRVSDKGIQRFIQQLKSINYLNFTNCVNAGIFTLSQLFHSKPHLTYLNLTNCFGISGGELVHSYNPLYSSTLFTWLNDLQYLNLTGCSRCTPKFLQCLLQNSPNLKTLILDGINLDEQSVQLFLQASTVAADITRRSVVRRGCKTNPLTLSLNQCHTTTQTLINFFSVRGADLISLNISGCSALTGTSLSVLSDCSQSLTHFYCTNQTTLNPTALSQFLLRTPRLRVLFLSGTSCVTSRVLQAARDSCLNITHLDISGCPSLTPDVSVVLSSMHSLQYLDVSFTPLQVTDIQMIINNLPRLSAFAMQGIDFTSPLLFNQEAQWLNALRLNFSKCNNQLLENISTYCPLLTTVELRMCSDVTDSGIQFLARNCTKLLNLVLTGTSVSQSILRFLSSRGVSIL
ncbi:Leucine-rich repeat containing protein [Entamoeba marina]